MTKIVEAIEADATADIAAIKADIAAIAAKVNRVKAATKTDIDLVWSHKAIVMFDVVMLIAAAIVGHYL